MVEHAISLMQKKVSPKYTQSKSVSKICFSKKKMFDKFDFGR